MKTVLLLALFLYAASAAPAEDKQEAPEAVAVAAVDAPEEQMAAAPVQEEEEEAAPEVRFNPCQSGWHYYGGRCFMLVTTFKSWNHAQEHCHGLGANLASVTNPTEYSFLQDITHGARATTAWLGGFYVNGGNWMWIDSAGFYYTNWYSQSSYYTTYPCIYLNSNYGWSNTVCSSSRYFICSKNPYGC